MVQVLQILDMTNCEIGVIARGGGGDRSFCFHTHKAACQFMQFPRWSKEEGEGEGGGGTKSRMGDNYAVKIRQ